MQGEPDRNRADLEANAEPDGPSCVRLPCDGLQVIDPISRASRSG